LAEHSPDLISHGYRIWDHAGGAPEDEAEAKDNCAKDLLTSRMRCKAIENVCG